MTCVYASTPPDGKVKDSTLLDNETHIAGIGVVKVLRAKVEYKVENGKITYQA